MENNDKNQVNIEFSDLEEQLLTNAEQFDELYLKTSDLKAKIKYNSGNFFIFGVPVICLASNYSMSYLFDKYGPEKIKMQIEILKSLSAIPDIDIPLLLTAAEMGTIIPVFALIGIIKNIMKSMDKKNLEKSKKILQEMKENNKDLVNQIKLANATDVENTNVNELNENNKILELKK